MEYRDQQNRTESPEINPSICEQFATKEKRIYNGERIVSSITGAGKIRRSHAKKKVKPDHYFTLYTKTTSQ